MRKKKEEKDKAAAVNPEPLKVSKAAFGFLIPHLYLKAAVFSEGSNNHPLCCTAVIWAYSSMVNDVVLPLSLI
jgi:hypothetical protein